MRAPLGFLKANPLLALARFLFLGRASNAIFLCALGPFRLFPDPALGVLFCTPLGIGASLGLGPLFLDPIFFLLAQLFERLED